MMIRIGGHLMMMMMKFGCHQMIGSDYGRRVWIGPIFGCHLGTIRW
jgi:hypothetical protein